MRHLVKLAMVALVLIGIALPAFTQELANPGVSAVVQLGPGGVLPLQPLAPGILGADDRYGSRYPVKVIWPTSLPDLEECLNQRGYVAYNTDHKKYSSLVPVAGTVTHKHVTCSWEATSTGARWTKRDPGASTDYDAAGRPLFDAKCGNYAPIVVEIRSPEPPRTVEIRIVVTKPEPPAPTPEPVRVAPPASAPPPPPPAPMPEPEENGARFGITTSVTPRFSTSPVNGLVSGMLNKDAVCVDGYALDAGLAWGRPRGSFLRVGFSYRSISDGSMTRLACPECNAQEIVMAYGTVRQYGLVGEAILRLPIGRAWPVQPMVSAHGGFGGWSGKTTSTVIRGTTATGLEAEPGHLLGINVFGGVGVGLVGGNDHWTVTGAGVIESPTGLGGRFTLTRWF